MAANTDQSGDVMVPSSWNQVVRGGAGEPEPVSPVAAPPPVKEHDLSPIKTAVVSSPEDMKKPVWNRKVNGDVETSAMSPVMGTAWPALGESTKAAIKSSSSDSLKTLSDEFLTEIKVISDIEHENLAKLIGCCVEGDHRVLVYDYIENNSLAQTLLGSGHSSIQFSWRTRTKICIGIARGLAFLHEEVRPHIVHRDIKASILLDKDLTPKISDFGLAKLIPANMTHVSTRVAGTIGYLAPEYAIRGQSTRRADVYSFGVLLVEIVSGRCNTNSLLPSDEQCILERVWHLYERNELVELVDTAMFGDFDAEEACKYLKIGLLCTQDNPKLRPVMSTVVKMLSGEMKIDETQITKPGLISDFMDLKVRSNPNKTADATNDPKKNTFNTSSPGSDNAEHSLLSSNTTSQSTMTFTDVWDRA